MVYVALAVNAGIIAFSKHPDEKKRRDPKRDYEVLSKMIIVEHVIFFLIFAISKALSDKPKWLKKK